MKKVRRRLNVLRESAIKDPLCQKQIAVNEQKIVLRKLAESVAYPGCRFLEVGSWCGESSLIFGDVARKNEGMLYCIDWWKGNIGTKLTEIATEEDIFSVFWKRISDAGLADVVIPIRGKSDDIAPLLRGESVDLVYIDGDHRYEQVARDIDNYSKLVRIGGRLSGDDCEGRANDYDKEFLKAGKNNDYHETVHCGVVLAVAERFSQYSIDYNIWNVVRTKAAWIDQPLVIPEIVTKRQYHPPLLESYKQYNLMRYGDRAWAAPHSLSDFDVTQEQHRHHLKVLSAKSVGELKQKIDQYG